MAALPGAATRSRGFVPEMVSMRAYFEQPPTVALGTTVLHVICICTYTRISILLIYTNTAEKNRDIVFQEGGLPLLLELTQTHEKDEFVQTKCNWAIAALAASYGKIPSDPINSGQQPSSVLSS